VGTVQGLNDGTELGFRNGLFAVARGIAVLLISLADEQQGHLPPQPDKSGKNETIKRWSARLARAFDLVSF
jgi:hypothetical protein